MTGGIFELAIVIFMATALGLLAKAFKQPVVLAYLVTGALIAYFGFFNLADKEVFSIFSDLGIMFLLFLIGLEINYTSLRLVGKTSLIVGFSQVIFTATLGFGLSYWMHFSLIASAYIAMALTFSSTVIVVKLLSDKREINSLYGKISIGALLIQDVIAVLLLVMLAGVEQGGTIVWWNLIFTVVKGVALFAVMLWLGRAILPALLDKIARSQELLFLTSLAWLFLVVAAASKIGFSIEIAGLLAGLALANSSEHFEIANKMRPLRDFFVLIFFVILGSSIVFSNFAGLTLPIIVFSLFVLIGNPLIVLIILGVMGHRKRTSFLAGVTIAQISEFSLVLVAFGVRLEHINESILAVITAVGIVTITLSTYLVVYADKIFTKISGVLSIFERRNIKEIELFEEEVCRPIVLVGCHRTGESIAVNLPKEKLLIVDLDPEAVRRLRTRGFAVLFGDIDDDEVFESAHIESAELLISTSPEFESSMNLLHKVDQRAYEVKTVVRAESEEDAKLLYSAGADYVLLPHLTSGQYLGKTIALSPEMEILDQLRENDLSLMHRIGGIKS